MQPNRKPLAPGLLPNVNPEDLKQATCKCGGTRFVSICELRYATRFQTTMGQPMLINFQGGYACVNCSKINEFNTAELLGNNQESVKN